MTIKPQTVHGRTRWRVTWRADGRCCRKFFKSESAAKTFAGVTKEEIKDYGSQFASLLGHERAALVLAFKRARDGGYTLDEALDHFEKCTKKSSSITVKDLVDKCLVAKKTKGLKHESYRTLKFTLDRFEQSFGERPAAKVTPADVTVFLNRDTWGQERRIRCLRDIRNLYNFGIRFRLLTDNPGWGVDMPIAQRHPIEIFSPKECREMLALVARKHQKCVNFIALCLFGGIRPAEAMKLKWSAVNTDTGWLELGSNITKNRTRRLLKMRDALVRWLTRFPRKQGWDWVVPRGVNYQRLRDLRAELPRWPRDVLRHTWVSYELAMSEDAASTALQAGHTEQVMFRHYRQLATREQAREFWALTPDKVGL